MGSAALSLKEIPMLERIYVAILAVISLHPEGQFEGAGE